jgi:hypothetical protein
MSALPFCLLLLPLYASFMYYESQESSSTMNLKNCPADTSNAHFRLFPATSVSARGRESPTMRNGRFLAMRVSRVRKSRVSLENSFGIAQFCALSLPLPHLHVWGLPRLPSPCSHRGITGFSLRGFIFRPYYLILSRDTRKSAMCS